MNIFYLSKDPKQCAEMHCDKHTVKMILEYAQMLSTAHRVLDGDNLNHPNTLLYKATHKNHPSNVWVREYSENYIYTRDLFIELSKVYTNRYHKIHKSYSKLVDSLYEIPRAIMIGSSVVPQCMPDEYKRSDPIEAYRAYYQGDKAEFATYKFSETPEFMKGFVCK